MDQKHRAGLSIQRLDMLNAVILLVRSGQLMLLDRASQIIFATGNPNHASLGVAAHHLTIKVEARLQVLSQGALRNKFPKIFSSFLIYVCRVAICFLWQIDFGFADMKEAKWVVCADPPRFFGRHNIVRQLADSGGKLRPGTQSRKRFHHRHGRERVALASAKARFFVACYPGDNRCGQPIHTPRNDTQK